MIGTTVSHYRITSKLGEGGMGEVYRAHDERLDRDVAIKVLPEAVAQDEARLARFEREAKAVARLAHPSILDVYELGEHEGRLFMATELLEGETLRDRLEGGSVGWQKASEIGAEVADGLAAAHVRGVVHRDLKPDNIFITYDGRVKILDFGLARVQEQISPEAETGTLTPAGTQAGTVMGTVGYMSPEQVRGRPADERSDIFALGCVLYEMLTGKIAFARESAADTQAAILKEEPAALADSGIALPAEFERTVRRCLEKSPEARFQSASDLAFALRSISTDHSVPVAMPVAKEVTTGRRRVLAILGGAAVIIAIAAVWLLRPSAVEGPADGHIPRIVVLPFENLGSPDDEYFADGITEEIASRLAAVSGLQVISRTSAMQYKEERPPLAQIGEELDVGYILEGTIRWDRGMDDHGRVRITPQLVRVADDSHLWSERYDRVLEDIFAVQSEIADNVITQLRLTILEPERLLVETRPTDNMEAYQSFLLGLQYLRRGSLEGDLRLSVEMFERAILMDPAFALAYANLSEAHSLLYLFGYDVTSERLQQAEAAAQRALELRPDLPEGHRALGGFKEILRDFDSALEHLSIAEKDLPNDPWVLAGIFGVYRRQGRWELAIEAQDRWQRADPQSHRQPIQAAITYRLLREYAKAEEQIRRAIALAPDSINAYAQGALVFFNWDGTTDRARRLIESAPNPDSHMVRGLLIYFDLADGSSEAVMARLHETSIDVFSFQSWYAPRRFLECLCFHQMGDSKRAEEACSHATRILEREIEAQPHDSRLHSSLGHAYAALGLSDKAIRAADRAVELMPISRDALSGPSRVTEQAVIYAAVGRHDQALDLIEEVLSIPAELSVARLRHNTAWAPLRDHRRFQEILEKYDTK